MLDEGVDGHARFSASSADRRALCPGSVLRCDNAPVLPDSPYAIEGRQAHSLLELCLTSCTREAAEMADAATPRDMIDGVQVALDYVYDILDRYPDAQLMVEQRVEFPSEVAPGEVWGTADITIYVPSICYLYVLDYKHGIGIVVEAEGNRQIGQYGTSVVYSHVNGPVLNATLGIIQPRAFHSKGPIREWKVSAADLFDMLNKIESEVEATFDVDARLFPGEKQCKFCAARAQCPAVEAKALAIAGRDFATVRDFGTRPLQDPATMEDLTRIADILDAESYLIDWLKAVHERAQRLAAMGYDIPRRKLVDAWDRRVWDGEPDDIAEQILILLGPEVTMDQIMTRKLINLTDAEDLFKEVYRKRSGKRRSRKDTQDGVDAMALLTVKVPSGKTTLVSYTDSRNSVSRIATTFASVALPPSTT